MKQASTVDTGIKRYLQHWLLTVIKWLASKWLASLRQNIASQKRDRAVKAVEHGDFF